MGLPAGLNSCPQSQDNLEVVAEERDGLHHHQGLALREPRLQPPGLQNVSCFGGHGVPQVSQQPGEPDEFPCEGSGRDPTGDSACGNSRVARVSQGLRKGRVRPF